MISIADKKNCCGCAACAQRCPSQCITMQEDEEGFLYPTVDAAGCISCGLCEKVCPCLHQDGTKKPLAIETAVNPDISVRRQSSSGGIFSLLAELVLNRSGIVFGAKFNDKWEVEHDYSDSLEGLTVFRGSKYVQSSIGDSYRKAEHFLKEGREVLFSGTPCQIAGLRLFLQKDYKNLLTVAIACHSVPSPLVWREYVHGLNLQNISDIRFRDKRISWEHYGLSITHGKERIYFQHHNRNPFMQLFLHGYSTRPSCFNCPAKGGRSRADLIIGDCWGVSEMLTDFSNDHLGTSIVICQTEHGIEAADASLIRGMALTYSQVITYNGGLTNSFVAPTDRSAFWDAFHGSNNKLRIINQFAKPFIPGAIHGMFRFLRRLKIR